MPPLLYCSSLEPVLPCFPQAWLNCILTFCKLLYKTVFFTAGRGVFHLPLQIHSPQRIPPRRQMGRDYLNGLPPPSGFWVGSGPGQQEQGMGRREESEMGPLLCGLPRPSLRAPRFACVPVGEPSPHTCLPGSLSFPPQAREC